MRPDFGVFEWVLEARGHLSLLGLVSDKSASVVERIRQTVGLAGASEDAIRLLADRNWRPHIVGGIAMVFDTEPERLVPGAWEAVDLGSWVAPQLVACLGFADPRFPEGVRSRIEAVETSAPSPKVVASLIAACEAYPSLRRSVTSLPELVGVQELLRDDIDNSGRIAHDWRERFVRLCESSGAPPAPRW